MRPCWVSVAGTGGAAIAGAELDNDATHTAAAVTQRAKLVLMDILFCLPIQKCSLVRKNRLFLRGADDATAQLAVGRGHDAVPAGRFAKREHALKMCALRHDAACDQAACRVRRGSRNDHRDWSARRAAFSSVARVGAVAGACVR